MSFESGRSAAWLASLPWEQEVVGSNPTAPTIIHKKGSGLFQSLFYFPGLIKYISSCRYRLLDADIL